MTSEDGSCVRDSYRLITTLLDHRRYPAGALVRLYHERWEIETAYLALRHTLLNGHVLRSGDRPGLEQELWALLTLYQLLRMAMVTAAGTRPGPNPDRAASPPPWRPRVTSSPRPAASAPEGHADLPGVIGRAVLGTLLAPRRLRYSARKVKCVASRYLNRDEARPGTSTAITAIDITIRTPPIDLKARPHRDRSAPRPSQPPTRRQQVMVIISTDPRRAWSGSELAGKLQVKPRNLLIQLAEWTRLGFLTRAANGTYALNTPP